MLVLLACSCAREDISDFSFVSGLRLLGAKAEPPEVMPGESVKLTAWAVDTRGGAIGVTWGACLLPSSGLANDGCVIGGAGTIALGGGTTITATVPKLTAAMLGPPDGTDGVYLPILLRAQANGDTADAVYRLRITLDGMERNQNPTLADIRDLPPGPPQPIQAGETWSMIAEYVDGSSEPYFLASAMKSVYENLTTQWFATAGTFPNMPVGGTAVQSLTFDRGLPAVGGVIDLWVVGHDERGGTDMMHGTFVLR
jgi:hypothetical protein